jgi:O-antigen/teichoic acid export membrane protein
VAAGNDPRDRRLRSNTLTLLTANAGSALLSLALSALIGRALGEDGLGVYAASLAYIFPLALLAEAGLNTLITRDLARDPAAEPDLLRGALAIIWRTGLPLALALTVIAPGISDDRRVIDGVRLSAPFVLIAPLFGVYTAIFRARRAMWPIAWLNLGMLAGQIVISAAVLAGGGDVRAVLLINMLTSAAQMIAAWGIYRTRFRQHEGIQTASVISARALLKRSAPFALAGLLAAVQMRAPLIALDRLADAAETGYYAAAARIIEGARMIPNALFGALLPALAALTTTPAHLARPFRQVMIALAAFGLATALILSVIAAPLLALIYGPPFQAAAPALRIAGWTLLLALLRSAAALYGYAHGREAFVNRVMLWMILAQWTTSVLMIPADQADPGVSAARAALMMLIAEIVGAGLTARPLVSAWWIRRSARRCS